MPSLLEQTVARYRAAVNARDDDARRDLLAAYARIRGELLPLAEALAADVAATGDPSVADLQRLGRYAELIAQVEEQMTMLAGVGEAVVRREQTAVVVMAGDHARGLASAQASRVAAAWNRLPATALTDLVGRMQDGSPLRVWLRRLGPQTGEAVADALVQGLAQGTGIRTVAETITKQTDLAASRALLTARTEILGAYRSATLATYAENADVLEGWRWSAARDRRCCAVCLALDGALFPLAETLMKAHPGCRCAAIPAVRGVVPDRETGAAWLARQPAATQDAVLTRAGGADYRAGALDLDDWVVLRRDARWGDSYQAASVLGARRNAERRQRRAA